MRSSRVERSAADRVEVAGKVIRLWLRDGRTLTVPTGLYPTLSDGAPNERNVCDLAEDGTVIRWPSLDLEVSTDELLADRPLDGQGDYAGADRVEVTEAEVRVWLRDGRTLTVPTFWFPRLCDGTADEWANIQVADDGWLRWPDLDEDLNVAGLLHGGWSGEAARSLGRWLLARRSGRRVELYEISAYHKSLPRADPLE